MKRTILAALLLAVFLTGCGGSAAPAAQSEPTALPEAAAPAAAPESGAPALPGLVYERAMEKRYAEQFDVFYYEGGYKLLAIGDGNRYLVVPEGLSAPDGLDPEVRVLYQPLDKIYLASTSGISLFDAMDALDTVKLTSLKRDDCYVENAAAAMDRGEILFGGKYSEPDYEQLVDSGVSLAIENTMILHAPKIIEMIENLGIPVFIENSSYEPHPLGRTEWVKLFAALIDREEAAGEFFDRSVSVMDRIEAYPNTGKTAAIFLIDSAGRAQVRSADDYLSKIIGIAGGVNAFERLGGDDESRRTNVSMTMEEFYATAMNVDYLIYNASGYSTGVDSVEKLLELSSLLGDCKAVREKNVWWIGPETYQHSDKISDLILDVHTMLTDGEGEMTFLHRME